MKLLNRLKKYIESKRKLDLMKYTPQDPFKHTIYVIR